MCFTQPLRVPGLTCSRLVAKDEESMLTSLARTNKKKWQRLLSLSSLIELSNLSNSSTKHRLSETTTKLLLTSLHRWLLLVKPSRMNRARFMSAKTDQTLLLSLETWRTSEYLPDKRCMISLPFLINLFLHLNSLSLVLNFSQPHNSEYAFLSKSNTKVALMATEPMLYWFE